MTNGRTVYRITWCSGVRSCEGKRSSHSVPGQILASQLRLAIDARVGLPRFPVSKYQVKQEELPSDNRDSRSNDDFQVIIINKLEYGLSSDLIGHDIQQGVVY